MIAAAVGFKKFREDGWPLCPCCGKDELYSPEIKASVETIAGCYHCGWRPGACVRCGLEMSPLKWAGQPGDTCASCFAKSNAERIRGAS